MRDCGSHLDEKEPGLAGCHGCGEDGGKGEKRKSGREERVAFVVFDAGADDVVVVGESGEEPGVLQYGKEVRVHWTSSCGLSEMACVQSSFGLEVAARRQRQTTRLDYWRVGNS